MKNVDNTAADQVIADCLNNTVIVKILLEHFPNSDLLANVQFVNKLWNHEARIIVRKRGNIFARIKCSGSNHSSCQQDFQAFAADVQKMNVIPFSGFHFSVHHDSRQFCSCSGQPILDQTHNVSILEMLPLKKVSISLGNKSWYKYNCPTFLLIKKVLENFHEALEELSLDIPHEPRELITKLVQHSTFPRLKILKLEEQLDTTQAAYTKYVMSLVRRSPKLQQLRVAGPLDLRVNVLKGSQAVLVCGSALQAPFNISSNLLPAIRPEAIGFKYTGPHFNFQRFNRMLLHLATTPSTTTKLGSITMDAVLAIPLMSSRIRFENVRNFDMLIDYKFLKHVEPRYLKIVQDFDFTRICPNLNKVRISVGSLRRRFLPADFDMFLVEAKAILPELLTERSINIRELVLHQSAITKRVVEFFSHMFPHIKQLEVGTTGPDDKEAIISYASIWKHWAHLEKLQVVVNNSCRSPNFDSIFCGIFPEEVAELRKQDAEYLRKVMIVPVMPAITCLRDLKTLTLVDLCPGFNGDYDDDHLTCFPSKVTALIAFARCPNLHVTLKTYLPQHYEELIRYMEPDRLVVCPPHGIHAT